jgi:hypothetical protein
MPGSLVNDEEIKGKQKRKANHIRIPLSRVRSSRIRTIRTLNESIRKLVRYINPTNAQRQELWAE